MRPGEVTEGWALSLASAVEAIQLATERDLLEVAKGFRGITPPETREFGENSHGITRTATFLPKEGIGFDIKVEVTLYCEGHTKYGHRWLRREASVTIPHETRPGYVFLGYRADNMEDALERCEFDVIDPSDY